MSDKSNKPKDSEPNESNLSNGKFGKVENIGKKIGQSNTERSRKYRLAKIESGGAEVSFFIGATALAALHVIVGFKEKSTKTQAIERALIFLSVHLVKKQVLKQRKKIIERQHEKV